MKPHTTRVTRPAPEFSFAGFAFPKWSWTLPTGSKQKRLAHYKNPVTGPYSTSPKPNDCKGTSFYLDSDFMPNLRWQWCDDVCKSIRHTGWFPTEYGDGDKIRGIVMRLPQGRGFLAGWSMGEGMASYVESSMYESEQDAARAADSLAEDVAEKEREYRERAQAEEEEWEAQETALNEPACLI